VKVIKQRVPGRLETSQDGTVIWWPAKVQAVATAATLEPAVYLSFAFVTRGPEEHILPALVLDDWGNEMSSLELYRWINEFGEQFPRAELFGYGLSGEQRQHFLRELELYVPYPCYAFATPDSSLAEATAVSNFLIADWTTSLVQPVEAPEEIEYPLRGAAVRWWSVPAGVPVADLQERIEKAITNGEAD
jgi:hypothetical protein